MVHKGYYRIFRDMNTKPLAKWIAIAKKVIRSVRRKMRQDKQQRLNKFFPLQITSRKNNITTKSPTPPTPPTPNMIQPSIITFLPPKQIETWKERSARNRSKTRTINYAIETTIINNTNRNSQTNHSKLTVISHPLSFKNSHDIAATPVDVTPNNSRHHHAISLMTLHQTKPFIKIPRSKNPTSRLQN